MVFKYIGFIFTLLWAYTFIKAANLEAGVENFSIIVNMVESDAQGLQHFTKFQNIVSRFLNVKLSYCGHIPFSQRIRHSVVERKPIMLTKQDTAETRAFMAVAKSIQSTPKNEPKGVTFFK